MTPRLGTDGNRIVYPIRGIVQGAREVGQHPQRRTLVYVTTLIAGAVLTTAGLLLAGYNLESPAAVLALAIVAAVGERISVRFAVSRRGLTSTEEQSLHLLPTLLCSDRLPQQLSAPPRCSGIPSSSHNEIVTVRHD